MAHYSACGIVLIHMQMDIAGCACNSNGGKKNDNQLTAKSCCGRRAKENCNFAFCFAVVQFVLQLCHVFCSCTFPFADVLNLCTIPT